MRDLYKSQGHSTTGKLEWDWTRFEEQAPPDAGGADGGRTAASCARESRGQAASRLHHHPVETVQGSTNWHPPRDPGGKGSASNHVRSWAVGRLCKGYGGFLSPLAC